MSKLQHESDASSSAPSIFSTYICREPIGDVALLINNGPDEYTSLLRTLQRSADHWAEKDHTRSVERLQLEIARLHMRNKQWQRGMRTLVPLWQTLTWRQAGWWSMLEEVDWALKECAMNVRDAETLVAVEWELMNRSLTKRQDSRAGFREALKDLEGTQARPMPAIRSENILSCVSAAFAFSDPEGSVGIPLESQLVLESHAHGDSAPLKLNQIRITFEGGLRNISLHHSPIANDDEELSSGSTQIQEISLQSSPTDGKVTPESPALVPSHPLSASANLRLHPGQTIVLGFTSIPREPGQIEVSSVTAYMKEEDFDLELIFSEDRQLRSDSFWVPNALGINKKPLKAERSTAVKILPKPPKMQISLPNLLAIYYVDEDIIIDLEISNEEEEPTKGSIDVRLLGPPEAHAKLAWKSETTSDDPLEEPALNSMVENGHQRLPTKQISTMEPGAQQKQGIHIKSPGTAMEYSLQIEIHYCLLSDPETPISKISSTDIVFVQPFAVTFNFDPRLHPDIWPNYFDIGDTDEGLQAERGPDATGLTQRWALSSRLTSLATDNLIIEEVFPTLEHIDPPETAVCTIHPTTSSSTTSSDISSQNTSPIASGANRSYLHTIDTQKLDLDDRHPVSIDLKLQIQYKRADPSISPSTTKSTPTTTSTTTILHVPRLDLNFEPRCLASLGLSKIPSDSATASSLIPLIYTIENPSAFALTFSISMDNNEAFAFSGPKSLSIQLLPLTRRDVEYRLLPIAEPTNTARKGQRKGEEGGGRWIWPHCVVIDTGFRKTLRVLPAVEGLKSGKRGEIGVWIEE